MAGGDQVGQSPDADEEHDQAGGAPEAIADGEDLNGRGAFQNGVEQGESIKEEGELGEI